jgi:hypothetical protein
MAKTQWHPAFAELLNLLLRDYYEIHTEVPVSELPRAGDVLLVRRHGLPSPPFEALWSHLREWNVIEFKGMTDHAEAADLEMLVHVGSGITARINERRREAKEPPLTNNLVAFWYVAPLVGQTFIEAAQGRSSVTYETEGVWQAYAWGHPVFFVSVRDLPNKVDSLPLLLLSGGSSDEALAGLFATNRELVERMGRWLFINRPKLWREVRTVGEGLKVDWDEVVKSPDADEVVRAMPVDRVVGVVGTGRLLESIGPEKVIQSIGPEKVIESMGPEKVIQSMGPKETIARALAMLPPEQRAQLLQSMMPESTPPAEEGGKSS